LYGFAGVERPENAQMAKITLHKVLLDSGIEESVEKSCPISQIMSFLGVLFNSSKMSMAVTSEKLHEILLLLSV
jgi:hypothetical protein